MDERLRRRARTGPASGDPAQRLHDLLRAGRLSTEALTCASALGEPAARELCRRLDLAGSDEAVVVSLSRLAGAEGITRLDLRGHPLGGPTLKPLETLPELRALDLDGKPHGVTAKALKGLRDLPLTHLRVGGCMLYDPDLAQLGAFPSLTHLDLQRTAAGAQTIDALVRRGSLRALDLSRCS